MLHIKLLLCHRVSTSVSPPLFPVSPQLLLSVESDKILKECEKERIPQLSTPQLVLFKDPASLVLECLKVSD